MPVRLILVVLLVAITGLARAAALPPDTPAGQVLAAWLDAMNSDDRVRQESFIKAYPTFGTLDDLAKWRSGVGGYELLEIYPSEATNVFFRVKQKSWPVEEAGRLEVSTGKPASIAALEVWRVPDGAKFEPAMLDETARARVIDRVADSLRAFHVDAATGKQLAASLRQHAAQGDYRDMRFIDSFARKLTDDLRAVGHDPHLEVRFNYFDLPAGKPERNPAEEAKRLAAVNCGFEKAELLPHNIGYVKLDAFEDAELCASTANAAMSLVSDGDALVLDLRDNHGGRGEMLALIASYLFAGHTHLGDSYRRWDGSRKESWTLPSVPGRKFLDKPVFVLISNRTFSAGEALSFFLQSLKRARLIGEATVGGSGAIDFEPIDAHFTLVLPTTQVTSAVTKQGWAGTGVQPDVKVPAGQALDTALKLAMK